VPEKVAVVAGILARSSYGRSPLSEVNFKGMKYQEDEEWIFEKRKTKNAKRRRCG
jgi:hypothetical protein